MKGKENSQDSLFGSTGDFLKQIGSLASFSLMQAEQKLIKFAVNICTVLDRKHTRNSLCLPRKQYMDFHQRRWVLLVLAVMSGIGEMAPSSILPELL